MRIRPFQPSDAEALAAIFHAAVREIGRRDYTEAQVTVWSPAPPDPARYLGRAEGRLVLVAENEAGKTIGYGDLEPDGHIDHLYVRPDAIGTGVGSALIGEIEREARERGISTLSVEASEGARRLFARRGYAVERRNEFTLDRVAIHNYRMVKPLVGEPR